MSWICSECALKHGGKMPDDHRDTFHPDICEICKESKSVTEPWGYGLSITGSGMVYRNLVSLGEFMQILTNWEKS